MDKQNDIEGDDEFVDDIVDIEELTKEGKKPPKARGYRFRVDKTVVETPQATLTGREILTLAGKQPPDNYILRQIVRGAPEKVGLDQVVDLRGAGVEKFRTLPRDQTEGFGTDDAPRRHFDMPEADADFLNGLSLRWEALSEGGAQWIVIQGWPVPAGYGCASVDVAINIAPGYPGTQLDMAYFHPGLARTDGRSINAATYCQSLDGKSWQRWSRHRTEQNPWVPGEDSLETHMALVTDWLTREFERYPS